MNLMGRAALQVTVRANGSDVQIVNAHLTSKLLTFPGGFTPGDEDQRARFAAFALDRRSSEATTLRVHVDGRLAGGGRDQPVILLGDMNDEVNAATTLILNGPPGSEIGSVGFDQPDQGVGDRMWNTAEIDPRGQTVHPSVPGPDGTERPHLRQPLPRQRHPDHRGDDRHRRGGYAVD